MSLPPRIVVLAGEGSLEAAFFKPMIRRALETASAAPRASLFVVAGRGERELKEQARSWPDAVFVRREPYAGPSDALQALAGTLTGEEGDVLVLRADAPLMTGEGLRALLARHDVSGADATAARAAGGVPPAAWALKAGPLLAALARGADPLADARDAALEDPGQALIVSDLAALALAEETLRARRNRELMLAGVRLEDPRTTVVDPDSALESGVRVEAGCTVLASTLAAGCVVESHCRVTGSRIGAGTLLRQGTTVDKSVVGRDCRLGPYARLRDGAVLADAVWIGNFVEIKNSTIGTGTRAAHLSFIGDAEVGRDVNIGCGFVTCNSSGRPQKQRTVIEDGVFIGSASQAIAPVRIGAGSFIATGTSVTDDAPPDSFVISRGRQVTKPGYAKKYGRPAGPVTPRSA